MMRSKLFVTGCVLLISVLGLIALSGCGSKGSAVQKVLDQVADPNVSTDTIDLRSCPPDFQEAFIAWKAIEVPFYYTPEKAEMLKSMGVIPKSYQCSEQEHLTALTLKNKAWTKVETVALRYGAQTGMSSEWGWWTTLKGFFGATTNSPAQ